MNLEQVEGQMSEYEHQTISVAIPIRGTVCQVFFGDLHIVHNWAEHTISYEIGFYPDAAITFQAQDVHKIVPKPNNQLAAAVILKSDTTMEQFKSSHA
jgi:hypothetical protein